LEDLKSQTPSYNSLPFEILCPYGLALFTLGMNSQDNQRKRGTSKIIAKDTWQSDDRASH